MKHTEALAVISRQPDHYYRKCPIFQGYSEESANYVADPLKSKKGSLPLSLLVFLRNIVRTSLKMHFCKPFYNILTQKCSFYKKGDFFDARYDDGTALVKVGPGL